MIIYVVSSLFLIALEIWGSLYFFDTFLQRKRTDAVRKYRYFIWLTSVGICAFSRAWIGWWRVVPIILAYMILCLLFYQITFWQSYFFSILNYCLVFIIDYLFLIVSDRQIFRPMQDMESIFRSYLIALAAKILWIVLLLLMRKIVRQKEEDYPLTNREWLKLSIIPIITLSTILAIVFLYPEDKDTQNMYVLLAIGMAGSNLVVIHLMQEILEKEKAFRVSTLAYQNQKNQLAAYEDGNRIYEQQRKKMHDYKNQLVTIQTLIKGEDYQTTLAFTEKLTESISVDMSAINTDHPVINAILNQKYRSAKEKNISMSLKLGNLHELKMKVYAQNAAYNGFCMDMQAPANLSVKMDWVSILKQMAQVYLGNVLTYSQYLSADRLAMSLEKWSQKQVPMLN